MNRYDRLTTRGQLPGSMLSIPFIPPRARPRSNVFAKIRDSSRAPHSLPFDIRLPASRVGSKALLSPRPVENICENLALAKIRIRKMRLKNRRLCPKKRNNVIDEISR